MRFAIVLLTAIALAACSAPADRSSSTRGTGAGAAARVIDVADGDSFTVTIDGSTERVRLIGVNAPELDECYGDEARGRLSDLIGDREITLVGDVEDRDQYGRLLRYVYVGTDLVNEQLVSGGFALSNSYPPNVAMQDELDDAAEAARSAGRGLWADGVCTAQSDLVIVAVAADAPGPDDENLNGEWIEIANTGARPASLANWQVRDAESAHRFTFPDIVLPPGESITLSTGCGENTGQDVYWCAAGPIWNNDGDTALLLDPDGRIVSEYGY